MPFGTEGDLAGAQSPPGGSMNFRERKVKKVCFDKGLQPLDRRPSARQVKSASLG